MPDQQADAHAASQLPAVAPPTELTRKQIESLEGIYGNRYLLEPAPDNKLPKAGMSAEEALGLVQQEMVLDGLPMRNLATFVTTWMEPEADQLINESLRVNFIDHAEYPQSAEIEQRCIRMLADLFNAPGETTGTRTQGSSEAIMLGALSLKWKWRDRRQAAGKSVDRPNLVFGGDVHVVWDKFCRYFDVEMREIPCEGSRLMMTPDEVLKRCDENTIGVVPTLGLTYTLVYEPVEDVVKALDDLQQRQGFDIPVHVDGASGGFIAPFIHPSVVCDFRLPRVKSINASGHKFGLAPLGCGWAIWRDAQDLPEELIFDVKYLGGDMPTFALNFSRPGGQIAAQYYNFVRLGRSGYAKITYGCEEVGIWLAEELNKFDIFEIIYDGRGGIPGCTWTLKNGSHPNFTLYDLSDRLRLRGWQVPAYPMPENRTDLVVQRVLARLGLSRDLAGLLLDDLERAIHHFEKHPSPKSTTHEDAGGYHH